MSNADRDRAGEHVALLLGVLLELQGELLDQGRVVRREPVDVGLRELDVEVVGHHPALPGQDLGVVVALALEGGGDLDGLHGAAERPGEGSGDQRLEPLLELLQPAHAAPPSRPVVALPVVAGSPTPAPVGRGPSVVGLSPIVSGRGSATQPSRRARGRARAGGAARRGLGRVERLG